MNFSVYTPVKILFGPGRVSGLGAEVGLHGRKVFIATMGDIVDLGIAEKALRSLKASGIEYHLYTDVKPDPKSDDIDAAAEILRGSGCDVLLGIGGGSSIDFAKALAICHKHPERIWSYVNLSNRPPAPVDDDKVLPVIAVPTTAGTGSEATPYAVVTNSETVQKGTIKEGAIFPRTAIVDPELTLALPPGLTAFTGVDALAHAIESYCNVPNRNPFSDMVAEEALKWITLSLPVAWRDGDNIEARAGMAWGSTLGGIAISQAGTTVAHALAQPLGARMGLSHGVSVSVFLLAVLRETLPADESRFAKIARILGAPDGLGEDEQARRAIDLLEDFLKDIEMPPTLSSLGAGDGIVDELAGDVMTYMSRPLKQHPKVFDETELKRIVRACF